MANHSEHWSNDERVSVTGWSSLKLSINTPVPLSLLGWNISYLFITSSMQDQPACPFKHSTSLGHTHMSSGWHNCLALKASSSIASSSQPIDNLWVTLSERQLHLLWEPKNLWDWFKDKNNLYGETLTLTNENLPVSGSQNWNPVQLKIWTTCSCWLHGHSSTRIRGFNISAQVFVSRSAVPGWKDSENGRWEGAQHSRALQIILRHAMSEFSSTSITLPSRKGLQYF